MKPLTPYRLNETSPLGDEGERDGVISSFPVEAGRQLHSTSVVHAHLVEDEEESVVGGLDVIV